MAKMMNRRQFVKTAGVAAGATWLSGCMTADRGAWRTAKGFTIDVIDPAKLPDGFQDIKRDKHVDETARQEGLI